MLRHRTIGSAPLRSAAEAWGTIRTLVGETLERSSAIERAEVDAALDPLDEVGRMLVSAGHLESRPLVLVAGELWLEIQTVSGGAALNLDENLNPVPGGAAATDWTVHIPQIEPMSKLVRQVAKGRAHLSSDEPVAAVSASESAGAALDLDAVARWVKGEA